MPRFVRLGDELINLEYITSMRPELYDGHVCVKINFIGGDCLRIFSGDDTYSELIAWIKKQPDITTYEV